MKNFKHLWLVVLIAIGIGAGLGAMIGSNTPSREKELREKYEDSLANERNRNAQDRNRLEADIKHLKRADSLKTVFINGINDNIKQDGVRVQKERKEAQALSTQEKVNFLLKRYGYLAVPDSTTTKEGAH